MANEKLEEFTDTSSELGGDIAGETPSSERTDAGAEAAVERSWQDILARNDAKNQKDELEENNIATEDEPDGVEPKAEKDEPAAEEKVEGEPEVTEEKEPQAAVKKDDGFDPNLKRIAKELGGWKDKDIEEFVAASPALARMTFANIAANFNAMSQQYAQATRQPQAAQTFVQQPVAANATTSALDELLANPAKLREFSEVAGSELTEKFIKPLLLERQAQREERQFVQELKMERLREQVSNTIESLAKDGFEDFYGKVGDASEAQAANQHKVATLGDQIRAGAQLQGINMGVKEALTRAHMIVTANQAAKTARKELVKQVVKRSTGIVARPSQRNAPKVTARGDEAAVAAVQQWNAEHRDV